MTEAAFQLLPPWGSGMSLPLPPPQDKEGEEVEVQEGGKAGEGDEGGPAGLELSTVGKNMLMIVGS